MGNTSDSEGGQSQLEFIQRLNDKHFAEIDIYKSSEGVYIMKKDLSHIRKDPRHIAFKHIIEYALRKETDLLIPIVHIATQQVSGLCLIYENISIYTEYYNYTLEDMISNKKVFEESELWLIFRSLLRLVLSLKDNKLGFNLTIDKVFLTLKGMPCISLHHLYSTENSITYSQRDMGELLARLMIQLAVGEKIVPREIEEENREILGPMAKVYSKFKGLGRLIKELFNRQKSEQLLLQEIVQLVESGRIKQASEIKLTKYKYLIPESATQNKIQYAKNVLPLEKQPASLQQYDYKSQEMVKALKKPIEESSKLKEKQSIKSVKNNSVKRKIDDNSSSKNTVLSEFTFSKNNIIISKQESSKLLTDLEKRKEEYLRQEKLFKVRKEQLLCESEKQNVGYPPKHSTQSKRCEKRFIHERKTTETSKNSRYR